MLQEPLNRLLSHQHLSCHEMERVLGLIMDGKGESTQIAALLIALRMNGENSDEIKGAALAMRARMKPITTKSKILLDTCGTGGSGSGSFNISTAVAFVVAAAGGHVAKHGNRAISSKSGSADVLEALGLNLTAQENVVSQAIDDIGIGFLFAPSHHPAMKYAAPIRKALKVRTLFNLLGPLTNPAGAKRQLLGVFSREWVTPLAQVLGELGSEHAWVVHGSDGLDEITLSGESYVAEWRNNALREFTITPENFGIKTAPLSALKGGDGKENSKTMKMLLQGKLNNPISDAVRLNAGAALFLCEVSQGMAEGVVKATDILNSGVAWHTVEKLIKATQSTHGN